MNALLYLTVHRFWNSLKRAPRNPRILIPVLAMVFFFAVTLLPLLFLGSRHGGRRHRSAPAMPPAAAMAPAAYQPADFVTGGPGVVASALRLFLLVNVFSSLLTAMGDGSLVVTQSDVDFLFPAPVSRRTVLLFKMLGRYAGLLIPAAVMPIAFASFRPDVLAAAGPLRLWPLMLGMWLFFVATANLAQAAVISRVPPDDPAADERAARRRLVGRWVVGTSLALLLATLVWAGSRAMAGGPGDAGRRLLHEIPALLNGPVGEAVLLPLTWVVDLLRVPFEGWSAQTAAGLLWLVLLAAGSCLVLFARVGDFYEGALTTSEKRTRTLRAARGDVGEALTQMAQEGKFARGRTLPPLGTGAMAVLWRDLIALTRVPLRSWGLLFFVAAAPALVSLLIGRQRSGYAVVLWSIIFTLNASRPFLLSARDMLRRADLTKALPISPARLLAADLATSAIQLVALGWLSLGLMVLLGIFGRDGALLIAALTLPAHALLLLFVQLIFVVLYPYQPGSGDSAQSSVAGLFSLLASVIALAPGLTVALVLTYLGYSPLVVAAAIAAADLIGAFTALQIAAILWRRMDAVAA